MKKSIILMSLLLLSACSLHENQEALDYLESSESMIISKRTGEEFNWEKEEEYVYRLIRDEQGSYVEYTIDFNEKYIKTIGYYKHEPEQVNTSIYYWESDVGTYYYKEDEDCFIKVNMNNKAYISADCNCTYLYESQEDYKNDKRSTIWWNRIYNSSIVPFLNTPIDPYDLQ